MTRDEVLALLSDLGDSPEQIAESLRSAHIRGEPGSMKRCPIANLLRSRGVDSPVVDPAPQGSISWLDGTDAVWVYRDHFEEVDRALQFAAFFDRGGDYTAPVDTKLTEDHYLALLQGAEEDG